MENVKEEVVKYELEEGFFKPKGHDLFATVDEKRRVLSIKSSCFDTPSEDDIIFDTGFGDEYVHTGIKYPKLTPINNKELNVVTVNYKQTESYQKKPLQQAKAFFGSALVEEEKDE